MEYMPKVLQAVAGENFTIYLYFSDGSVRLYDAKPILERGGVFEPMRDENFFREHLTVLNDTAAWDVNRDFQECLPWLLPLRLTRTGIRAKIPPPAPSGRRGFVMQGSR